MTRLLMSNRTLKLVPLAAATLLAVGCAGGEQAAPAPPAPEVTVAQPEIRDVVNYLEFTGTTTAIFEVDIRARVPGTLEQITFEPSSSVEEGELLFVIEQEPYRAAVAASEAGILQWEAELARAEADLERLELAVRTNAVSEQEVDGARAAVKTAEANLLAAQAGLEQSLIDLGYTEVRSPIVGLVSRNLVDAGNIVGSGENTLLTTVMTIDPIYAYFNVSEAIVLQLLAERDATVVADTRQDTPVFLGLANDVGWPHEGIIDYIDNTVDPNTGTIQTRGLFPNPEILPFPGLFARIRVPGPPIDDAVLVREDAIGTDLGGKFVLVVGDDNVVELRHVELGALQEDGMRVVASGMDASERYIVNGLQRARPGLPVTPTTAAAGAGS